ncbi:chemerin-like receptor 1 [Latimeria chalumnae]|uniref:chemerin-like receptor 1 n=1 Tax=Latimeria chalumnae TaxID=7897 RepID=UPI0003C1789D
MNDYTASYYPYYEDYSWKDTLPDTSDPSEDKKPQEENILRIVSIIIYSIAFLFGVLGNGLVIWITGFRMKKAVNTTFFLHLAIADFIFTFFLPLTIVYNVMHFHWPFGKVMCKLNSFILLLNMYTSVILLTFISFDRCISVINPVWSQNHRTTRLASSICLASWFIALLLSIPSLVFRDTAFKNDKEICHDNFLFANETYMDQNVRIKVKSRHYFCAMTRFLCGFFIPFIIITLCYTIIAFKLKRNRLAKSKKPFKIIITIVVAFFVCWVPYHVFQLLETKFESLGTNSLFKIGIPITTALATCNSFLNPIFYVFMGQDFKRFKQTLFSRFEHAFSEETINSRLSVRSMSKVSSFYEKDTANL